MGLRNLQIPTKTVEVADGVSFTVRGFSPNDAVGLYHRHAGDLSSLFDEFAANVKKKPKGKDSDAVDVKALGVNMVGAAPRIMAEIIAIASGSDPLIVDDFEADVAMALNLSGGASMDALSKIGDLTFTSDMPPGKFLAVVVKLAQSATAAMTRVPAA